MVELSPKERWRTNVARFVHSGTAATGVEIIAGGSVTVGPGVIVAVGGMVGVDDASGVLVGITTSRAEVLCPAGELSLVGLMFMGAFFEEQALNTKIIAKIKQINRLMIIPKRPFLVLTLILAIHARRLLPSAAPATTSSAENITETGRTYCNCDPEEIFRRDTGAKLIAMFILQHPITLINISWFGCI